MTRSLGIHIGVQSIKIVELQFQGKGCIAHGVYQIDLDEGIAVEEQIKQFLQSGTVQPDKIHIGLGENPYYIHRVSYPFSDLKKVEMAALAELEDTLPFDIEGYTFEFKKIGKEKRNSSFLLGLCSEKSIENLNGIFKKVGTFPSSYVIEAEALGRLALHQSLVDRAHSHIFCVIDIGYKKTNIALLKEAANTKQKVQDLGANMLELRTIARGSWDLIDWLSKSKKMSEDECRQWLVHRADIKNTEENGSHLSDETSNELKLAIRPLFVEIYQTLQAFRNKYGFGPKYALVAGDLVEISGFLKFISKELRLDAELWNPFQYIDTSRSALSSGQEKNFASAVSLAFLSKYKNNSWLNFRRSSQAQKQVITQSLKNFFSPEYRNLYLSYIAFFAVFWGAWFVFNRITEEPDRKLKRSLLAQVRAVDPKLNKKAKLVIDDVEAFKEMLIDERNLKLKGAANENGGMAQLEVLRKLSLALPQDTSVFSFNAIGGGKGFYRSTIQSKLSAEKLESYFRKRLEPQGLAIKKFEAARSSNAFEMEMRAAKATEAKQK